MRRVLVLVGTALVVTSALASESGRVPLKKDECVDTTIVAIQPRLNTCVLGARGQTTQSDESFGTFPGSKVDCGFYVGYAFGDGQTSFQTVINVKDDWHVGD